MRRRTLRKWLIWTLGVALGSFIATAQATEQEALVDKARLTVEALAADENMAAMRTLLTEARAVIVIPEFLKGGFILGGSGGNAVLLDRRGEGWGGPALYTMAGGSIGLQIGGQISEVVLLIMTPRALDAVVHAAMKLGVDAVIAAGPIGVGVEAATTTNLGADIYSFARTKGLFIGASLEGSVIKPREEWNRKYYGEAPSARQIIVRDKGQNDQADELKAALNEIAGSG